MKLSRFVDWLFFKLLWLGLFFWLLWRMAPSLQELSPFRLAGGMATSVELVQIEEAVEGYRATNQQYPEDFGQFLKDSFSSRLKRVTLDSWGTPYEFERNEQGYVIRSAGPDRLHGTEDDYYLVHGEEPPPALDSAARGIQV